MQRARAQRLAWIIGGAVAFFPVLAGCEALLDVGSLKERGASDGGGLASMAEGGSSSGMGEAGSSGSSPAPDSGVAGSDSGSSSGVDSGSSSGGGDGGACAPGTQRCTGANVETCSTAGQWDDSWACATGMCTQGACAGSTTAGTSCTMGGSALTHCGGPSEASGGESCCTSLEVPGGTFDRRFTNTGAGPTDESDPATVSGYRLDKYLVTVGRFRQFVAAWNGGSGYLPQAGTGKHAHVNGGSGLVSAGTTAPYETGWLTADDANVAPDAVNLNCGEHATWTAAAGNNENLAMNCVDWAEAYAFCIWDGGFLPTEVEWEYAAAGGSQQREYPWGSADPSMSGAYATYQCNYPPGTGSCMTTLVNIAPVGTATQGAGLWLQLDLVGNMRAWGLDWYFATYTDPCVDCAYLNPTGDGRIVKGASFETLETDALLPTIRSDALPDERADDDGFRCARTP